MNDFVYKCACGYSLSGLGSQLEANDVAARHLRDGHGGRGPVAVSCQNEPFALAADPDKPPRRAATTWNVVTCAGCFDPRGRHAVSCPKRIREHQIQERTPSAVAKAPERMRDAFADLCDAWDLLPDAP